MNEYICIYDEDEMTYIPNPYEEKTLLVRCKDCKHRPKRTGDEGNGFDFEFPDERCPCQCEDGWYNRMPKGDWFCGNGERKEDGNN